MVKGTVKNKKQIPVLNINNLWNLNLNKLSMSSDQQHVIPMKAETVHI